MKGARINRLAGVVGAYVFAALFCAPQITLAQDSVGKWYRHVISLTNESYSGNPFELEVDATFTHEQSGATLTLPGYYAGNDTWKVAFMPTRTGEWTYVTSSSDSDLSGVTGVVNAVDSGHPGILKADTRNPKKWKYADGPYAVPLMFLFDVAQEPGSRERFTEIADFLKNDIRGHMFDFRLTNEKIDPSFPIFAGDWRDHEFDLSYWDRLEERMEILTERGLGVYVMFYSDDGGEPAWSGRSSTEALLIRYTVARLAAFPVVWFDTGIDIAEFRGQSDIDWLGRQVRDLDPYGHPISSRRSGGSGSLVMEGRSYESWGDRQAYIDDMRGYFEDASIPVSMNDAYMEEEITNRWSDKNFKKEDIRRAAWKCVVSGGLGMIVRGSNLYNSDLYFRMEDFEEDLESEQWLRLVKPFVESKLGETFGEMVPAQSLVSNGYALADPQRTKIMYFAMGKNDQWDSGNGGAITVRLTDQDQNYEAEWFDTRTGSETSVGVLNGGENHDLNPPSSDDWVLLLVSSSAADVTRPKPPKDLGASD